MQRAFPSECRARAIPVIAPVYIGPLASGVSRTAFVFEPFLAGKDRELARASKVRFDPRPLAREQRDSAGMRFSRFQADKGSRCRGKSTSSRVHSTWANTLAI